MQVYAHVKDRNSVFSVFPFTTSYIILFWHNHCSRNQHPVQPRKNRHHVPQRNRKRSPRVVRVVKQKNKYISTLTRTFNFAQWTAHTQTERQSIMMCDFCIDVSIDHYQKYLHVLHILMPETYSPKVKRDSGCRKL